MLRRGRVNEAQRKDNGNKMAQDNSEVRRKLEKMTGENLVISETGAGKMTVCGLGELIGNSHSR